MNNPALEPKKVREIRFYKYFVVILLSIAAVGGLGFGALVGEVSDGNLSLLAGYRPSRPTRLYDIRGRLFAEIFRHRQDLTRYDRIPPEVIQAFLAVEDDHFYYHHGFDLTGIFRAAIKNILAGRIVQGGSTLTQQVAKQIFLNAEKKRDKTFIQKIRETVLALKMEEALSKEEILELYFNVIYLGHGCEGLSCASSVYFNKRVEDLTLGEAALLARLPKSPVEYSPYKYPENAKSQHKFVLDRMVETGYISNQSAEEIHNSFWNTYWGYFIVRSPSKNIRSERLDLAPYFTEYVRNILEQSPEVGEELLYSGGLRVYTTLDLDEQQIAQQEMDKALENANRIGRNYAKSSGKSGVDMDLFGIHRLISSIVPVGGPVVTGLTLSQQLQRYLEDGMLDAAQLLTYFTPADREAAGFEEVRKVTRDFTENLNVEGAFISLQHSTGGITAMIGGREFSPQNQFNRALFARRQPGSAFKIFVYGAALENRVINSMTPLNDAPLYNISDDGSSWAPANYDEGFMGMVPATMALAYSLNTCSVQTYYKVGPTPIVNLAMRMMKITSPRRFNYDPALSLGSSEITPMELAIGTAIIANDGKNVIPYAIRSVKTSGGDTIYSQEKTVREAIYTMTQNQDIQVIEPGLAYILRKMMETTANSGTVTRGLRTPGEGGFRGDMAGKTGTTSSWSDAWVTGFNPQLTTVVWFGFDKSSITLGPGQAGGYIASPVLGSVYRRYYQKIDTPPPSFKQRPDGDQPPNGLVSVGCNGWALGPTTIKGVPVQAPADAICGISEETRIYDQRELLMKELGITPEEIGGQKGVKIRFRD